MTRSFDVAVIGGGIVGLAHAWMATRRGLSVLLLERSTVAQGASVRNFGMIWPIGQPAGELYDVALRSRDFWLKLGELDVLPVQQCGSIHLAHREDELELLNEFCEQGSHEASMLSKSEVVERSRLANPQQLLGGMFSPTELRVDPRIASRRLAAWLEQQGVVCCFGTPVVKIEEDQTIHAADGRVWSAKRVVVCSGSDLQTLFPAQLQESGLQLCKLQMLRSNSQAWPAEATPHIASGLTLRHYASFSNCRSLESLRRRIAWQAPELDRHGIHVMASMFDTGEVILGDSHQYEDQITPFDSAEIDDLILRELHKVIQLSDWTITQRWHGVYAKHPRLPVYEADVADGIHVFVGTGGAGMTMSFGLADRAWRRWTGEGEIA